MKTLQDYIKLAESATDGPWNVQKSPFEVYNVDHGAIKTELCSGYTMIAALYNEEPDNADNQFIAESRTLGPAMAKALIEAEEALKIAAQPHLFAAEETYKSAQKALSQIQALNGGENDKQR